MIRETPYCETLAEAWTGEVKNSICLQRILVKEHDREEIRMAWWSNGLQVPRPADLETDVFAKLLSAAIKQHVFKTSELVPAIKTMIKYGLLRDALILGDFTIDELLGIAQLAISSLAFVAEIKQHGLETA